MNQLNRNAKDLVFKNLLENKENIAQFYFDLTGKRIDPKDIDFDSIVTQLVKGKAEDVAFRLGSKYIILFEAQSTWKKEDILRFASYMFILFINFLEAHEDEIFESQTDLDIPAVEAYVIYTGSDNLPEMVSLKELFSDDQQSMINAQMQITTLKNARGMVREYIEFSKLETDYYRDNKRSKNDVLKLINYCIQNNILTNYMLEHRKEVTNLIENFFTEERRIQGIVNEAVYKTQQELDRVKAEKEQMKRDEIIRYFKLNIPVEKIIEVTGYPIELINEVLNQVDTTKKDQ